MGGEEQRSTERHIMLSANNGPLVLFHPCRSYMPSFLFFLIPESVQFPAEIIVFLWETDFLIKSLPGNLIRVFLLACLIMSSAPSIDPQSSQRLQLLCVQPWGTEDFVLIIRSEPLMFCNEKTLFFFWLPSIRKKQH